MPVLVKIVLNYRIEKLYLRIKYAEIDYMKKEGQYLIILLFFIYSACNPIQDKVSDILDKSGNNRVELEKVINHYKETGEKEKLKAAYFLIGNMQNKYGRYGDFPKNYFSVFKSLHKLHNAKTDQDTINKIIKRQWDSIEKIIGPITYDNYKPYNDFNVVTAEFLIENIDYAFMAWKEKPWAKHLNFDQFCEFILPYRVYDEPLQFYRKNFYKSFSWLEDSLKNKSDPIEACLILNQFLAKKFVFCSKLDRCPMLGINDMNEVNGGICEHRYYLLATIMRSVGIPIGIENTPQRNDEVGGHSWMVLIDSKGTSRFFNGGEPDVTFPDTLYDPIGKGFTTKVYRCTYAEQEDLLPYKIPPKDIPDYFKNSNIKDVTNEYQFPQTSVKFDLAIKPSDEVKYAYLCCFGYSSQIVPVDYKKPFLNSVKFQNVGTNCVYFPAYYFNNQYTIANNPVYISKKGEPESLSPNISKLETIKLTRKFYAQQYLFRMNDFAKSMFGAKLQASDNKDFKNPYTIFTIDSSYYHFVEKDVKMTKSYQYYRYMSSDTGIVRIAEVDFVVAGQENMPNKNKMFKVFGYAPKDTINHYKAIFENAFDGNIATNFNAIPGSWVAIDYGKPVTISKVRFLVRNDLNVVEIGDEYELFYFDFNWKSLGRIKADKNYLIYNNVPENALLLLRDLTKGREERIFRYKNGQQIWL